MVVDLSSVSLSTLCDALSERLESQASTTLPLPDDGSAAEQAVKQAADVRPSDLDGLLASPGWAILMSQEKEKGHGERAAADSEASPQRRAELPVSGVEEGGEPAAREKPVRVQEGKKPLDIWRDTPVRLLGYANEVGEAFRHNVPRA